uniref:Putative secreted protein n=1 Tax=Anopheles marajoara TaxID=58244 RepID=A0A2M4CDX7_9DIPT
MRLANCLAICFLPSLTVLPPSSRLHKCTTLYDVTTINHRDLSISKMACTGNSPKLRYDHGASVRGAIIKSL